MWIGALDNREKLVPLLGAPNNDADGCQPGSSGVEVEFGDEERAQDPAPESESLGEPKWETKSTINRRSPNA